MYSKTWSVLVWKKKKVFVSLVLNLICYYHLFIITIGDQLKEYLWFITALKIQCHQAYRSVRNIEEILLEPSVQTHFPTSKKSFVYSVLFCEKKKSYFPRFLFNGWFQPFFCIVVLFVCMGLKKHDCKTANSSLQCWCVFSVNAVLFKKREIPLCWNSAVVQSSVKALKSLGNFMLTLDVRLCVSLMQLVVFFSNCCS